MSDPYGKEAHRKFCPEHSDNYGHECPDWDFLYICEDCDEFDACTCIKERSNELNSKT